MDNLARNFILQLASLVTLFVSIPAFITLVFGLINIVFPDAAESYWRVESAREGIRISIAVLVIFFPAYLLTTRIVNKSRRSGGALYHTLTKWLIYLALLVAGLIMLIDLAVVVMTFLNGEITVRFILKAVTVLAVIGAAFYYYLQDAKNFWQDKEKQSIQIGLVALVVVCAFVVIAFTKIETPQEVRDSRIDQEQISDLQVIQNNIEFYYHENQQLPTTLSDVHLQTELTQAPVGRAEYTYKVTDETTYELCAEFVTSSDNSERPVIAPLDKRTSVEVLNYDWRHTTGEVCFARKILEVTE